MCKVFRTHFSNSLRGVVLFCLMATSMGRAGSANLAPSSLTAPNPPPLISPGSPSEPGPILDDPSPTFHWQEVSGADYYSLAISRYPYGPSNVIYDNEQIYGTYLTIPVNTLAYNEKYRWNMQAHNSAGWSSVSNTFYFQMTSQTDTIPPIVDAFSTNSSTVTYGAPVTFQYTVSDLDGSGLNRVELWRAIDNSGSAAEWSEIQSMPISGGIAAGSISDSNPPAGAYWYGLHVVDNAGNWGVEPSPPGLIWIVVIPNNSYTFIYDPASMSNGMFDVRIDESGGIANTKLIIKNNKPYWTNFHIESFPSGITPPLPADNITFLCDQYRVIPPNGTLTYRITPEMSGEWFTIYSDLTSVSGWNAMMLNADTVLVKLVSAEAEINVDDLPKLYQLYVEVKPFVDVEINLIKAIQPNTTLADRIYYLKEAAKALASLFANQDNLSKISIKLSDVKWFKDHNISSGTIFSSLQTAKGSKGCLSPLWQVVAMIWDTTIGNPAGFVIIKAVDAPGEYSLSTNVDPANGGTVTPNAGSYDDGTTISLNAWPAPGFIFDHWEGDVSGNASPMIVVINGSKNVIAHFSHIQRPDLSVSPVIYDPLSVNIGQPISVTFAVKNNGGSSSGTFHNRISLSTTPWGTDYALGNFETVSLEPGASSTITITSNAIPSSVPPGNYYVTVFTDAFSEVDEANETNNISTSYPDKFAVGITFSPPSGLVVAFTSQTQVSLSWNSSPDAPANIDGYRIYRDDLPIGTVGSSTTTYNDNGLNCGTTYRYDVRAYKGNSESDTSNIVNVSADLCASSVPYLTNPLNNQVYVEGDSVVLSWQPNGNEYYGEIWGGPGGTFTFGWQSEASESLGTPLAGYTYFWHIKSRNGTSESSWSDTWTFTVNPATPTNLVATVNSCHSVGLMWNDRSGNEAGYYVYRDGVLVAMLGSNITNFQDDYVAPNIPYTYYVKSYQGSILSNASNTAFVTTISCPPLPRAFEKFFPVNTSTGQPTRLTLGWEDISSGITYEYCVDTINNNICDTAWANAGPDTGTPYGTSPNTTYYWQVRARNAGGVTEANNGMWWSFTTQGGLPPDFSKSVPANAIVGEWDTAILSWESNPGAESYELCYDTVDNNACDSSWQNIGNATMWNINGLTPATTYYWQIRAKNTSGTNEANTGQWWSLATKLTSARVWKAVDSIALSGSSSVGAIAINNRKAYVARGASLLVLDLNSNSEIANIPFSAYSDAEVGDIAFWGYKAYVALYNLGSNGQLAIVNMNRVLC